MKRKEKKRKDSPQDLPKPCSFRFELTNTALARERQNTLHTDPSARLCYLLSVCTWLDLMWSLQVCCVPPPGPVSNKFLCFTFPLLSFVEPWLTIQHPDTLRLYIPNINLTKSQHQLRNVLCWEKETLGTLNGLTQINNP